MFVRWFVAICSLAIVAGSARGNIVTYELSGAGGAIPDNDPVGLSSTVFMGALPGGIKAVVVRLDVDHTWVGDLSVTLTLRRSPEQPVIVGLFDRPGYAGPGTFGDDSDLAGAYFFDDRGGFPTLAEAAAGGDGDYVIPPGFYSTEGVFDLTTFVNMDPRGEWTLTVVDNAFLDTGELRGWSLSLHLFPAPGPLTLAFAAAGMWARRDRRGEWTGGRTWTAESSARSGVSGRR